ncbi:MAG: hypothetical protein WCB53_20770 [Terriglobales bacterium]
MKKSQGRSFDLAIRKFVNYSQPAARDVSGGISWFDISYLR